MCYLDIHTIAIAKIIDPLKAGSSLLYCLLNVGVVVCELFNELSVNVIFCHKEKPSVLWLTNKWQYVRIDLLFVENKLSVQRTFDCWKKASEGIRWLDTGDNWQRRALAIQAVCYWMCAGMPCTKKLPSRYGSLGSYLGAQLWSCSFQKAYLAPEASRMNLYTNVCS